MSAFPVPYYIGVVVFQLIFFVLYEKSKHKRNVSRQMAGVFKCAVTFSSFVLAVVFACRMPQFGSFVLCFGMLLDTVADYVLIFRFIRGMAIFGMGHAMYCLAFVSKTALGALNVIVTLSLFLLCSVFVYFMKDKLRARFPGQNPAPFVAYAFVSCLLLGAACTQNGCLFSGAVLFVISDCMLATRFTLNIKGRPYDYLSLFVYYAAQLLLATGLFFN